MERLTEKHYLGTDHYMKCSGDCNVDMDCIDCPAFDRLVERLAAYEDTGLTPEEINELLHDTTGPLHHKLGEWIDANASGRLAVLPCKADGAMLDTSYPDKPRLMERVHFAVAYVSSGIVFHQPYNIFLENIAAGYIKPVDEEAMRNE